MFLFHYNALKLWVNGCCLVPFYGKPFEHASYFEHIKRIEMLKNIAQKKYSLNISMLLQEYKLKHANISLNQ